MMQGKYPKWKEKILWQCKNSFKFYRHVFCSQNKMVLKTYIVSNFKLLLLLSGSLSAVYAKSLKNEAVDGKILHVKLFCFTLHFWNIDRIVMNTIFNLKLFLISLLAHEILT